MDKKMPSVSLNWNHQFFFPLRFGVRCPCPRSSYHVVGLIVWTDDQRTKTTLGDLISRKLKKKKKKILCLCLTFMCSCSVSSSDWGSAQMLSSYRLLPAGPAPSRCRNPRPLQLYEGTASNDKRNCWVGKCSLQNDFFFFFFLSTVSQRE